MTRPVYFVQGAGPMRASDGSGGLVDWLVRELGDGHRVVAPEMPDADNPRYRPWRDRIERDLAELDEPILVGHSVGASVLVKHLAERSGTQTIAGLFMVATPWWGPEGWDYAEYAVPDDVSTRLPDAPVFLYHSRHDPVVEFAHLELWAARLPGAARRPLEGSQHSFTGGLPELAADVIELSHR